MADRISQLLGNVFADGPTSGASAVASPPSTNGNGKAHHAPEQKGVILRPTVDFVGPNGTGNLVYVNGLTPSDVEEVTEQTALAAAAYAYRAITYRAQKCSEPELYVIEEEPDGEEETTLEDHEIADLLREPSPDFDIAELLFLTRVYRDTTGAALWVKNRNVAGGIGMITVFGADQFDVEPGMVDGTRRLFGKFTVRTRGGEKREYGPDDVVYFREPAGVSPLHAALGMLNLGQRAQTTVRDVLANALFPSVIIQTHPEWSPDDAEFDRFKGLVNRHAEPGHKGDPFILTGGGTASVVSMNLKELMPGDVLDRVEATVASVFGIPAVVLSYLVGLKHSPWSQMAEARRMAYEDTILPILDGDERKLTRQLLRPIDEDPTHRIVFDTSRIPALQADRKTQAEIAEKVRDIGTKNERRALMGWDPEPWGDEPPKDGVAADPTGSDGTRTSDDATGKAAVHAMKASASTFRGAAKLFRFDVMTKAQEAGWESAASAQLAKDRAAVLDLFDRGMKADGAPEAKAPPFGPADPDKVRSIIEQLAAALAIENAWRDRVTPLVESTAKTAQRDLVAELGIGFDVAIPGLEDFVQREAAWLVTNVSDTTRQMVRDALEQGLKEGESIDRLRKRLEESGAFSRSRAELIARTETTRVTNSAQVEATQQLARDLRVQATKTWVATRDSRVRDSHLSMDGETVPVDQNFPNGRSAPGEPNCRCSLTYALEGDDAR